MILLKHLSYPSVYQRSVGQSCCPPIGNFEGAWGEFPTEGCGVPDSPAWPWEGRAEPVDTAPVLVSFWGCKAEERCGTTVRSLENTSTGEK